MHNQAAAEINADKLAKIIKQTPKFDSTAFKQLYLPKCLKQPQMPLSDTS